MKKVHGIKKMIKRSCMALLAVIIIAGLFRSCLDTLRYEKSFDATYSSPLGTRTILVRYDYVSRPSVFIDGERLFYYEGNGFQETVAWNVTWVSEQQIILSYDDKNDAYDEAFYIDIPS